MEPLGSHRNLYDSQSQKTTVVKELKITPPKKSALKKIAQSIANGFDVVKENGEELWGYLKNKALGGGLQAVKFIALAKGILNKTYIETQEQLLEITGDAQFAQFLEELTPTIGRLLKEVEILKAEVVQNFLYKESKLYNLLINVMLSKVMVNVAKHIQETRGNNKPLKPIEIVAHLIEIVLKRLEEVQPQLAEAESIPNPKESMNAQYEVIKPLVDDLLVIMFPKGMDELMIRVGSSILWIKIKKGLLPKALLLLGSFLRGPEKNEILEAPKRLKAIVGSELMASAAEEAAHLATGWGRDLLQDPEIAKELAGKVENIAIEDSKSTKERQQQRKEWLTEQVRSLADIRTPTMENFWDLLDESVKGILSYLLLNLSRGKKTGDEASIAIYMNVVREINGFAVAHGKAIDRLQKKLEAKKINPREDPEYIQQFIPLARRIQRLSGLIPNDQRIPGFLREIVATAFHQRLPAILAQHYESMLLPLAEMSRKNTNETEREKICQYTQGKELAVHFQRISKNLRLLAERKLIYDREKLAILAEEEVGSHLPGVKARMRNIVKASLQGIEIETTLPPEPLSSDKRVKALKTWIHNWISIKLGQLGTSTDVRVKQFWLFIEQRIQDLLAHVILHAAKTDDLNADLSLTCFNHIVDYLTGFYQQYGAKIATRYQQLNILYRNPATDAEFVGYMRVFCTGLLDRLGFSKEDAPFLPKIIIEQLHWFATEKAPILLASQYRETMSPMEGIQTCRAKLEDSLGIDTTSVKKIEDICTLLAIRIANATELRLKDEASKLLGKAPISLENEGIKQFRDGYVSDFIKSLLMQLFANYADKISTVEGTKTLSLEQLLAPIGRLLHQNAMEQKEEIARALKMVSSSERRAALAKTFVPFVDQLFAILTPRQSQVPLEVPFASLFGDVWDKLKEQILPEVFADMLLDSTVWSDKISDLRLAIRSLTETEHTIDACSVMAEYTAGLLPPMLALTKSDLAETIVESLRTLLAAEGITGASVETFLKEHEEGFKQTLAEEIYSALRKESPALQYIKPATKEYLKAVYLKIFKNTYERIKEKEEGLNVETLPDFLVDTGLRILGLIKEHFQKVNDIIAKKGSVENISIEEFIAIFAKENLLSTGFTQSPEALGAAKQIRQATAILKKERLSLLKLTDKTKIEAAQKRINDAKKTLKSARRIQFQERKKFLKLLSETLQDIVGIKKPEDLPLPNPLKTTLWNTLQEELFPLIANSLYELAISPRTMNQMLLAYSATLNELLSNPAQGPEYKHTDEKQKKVDKICGEVIKEFVKYLPDPILSTAFRSEQLNKISTEVLGQIFRRQLGQDWTLTKILDRMMMVTKGSLKPEQLILPETEEEFEADQTGKIKSEAEEGIQARLQMVASVKRLVSYNIDQQIKGTLTWLRHEWISAVHTAFGKYGPKVVSFFENLVDTAFYRICEMVLMLAFKPVSMAFWLFSDQYIDWKVNRTLNAFEMDIHENLLQKIIEELCTSLAKEKRTLAT